MNEWIAVEGYSHIPIGEWLVYIPKHRNKFHVAVMHTNLQVIGGNFAFDMLPVTHYQALPVDPDLIPIPTPCWDKPEVTE